MNTNESIRHLLDRYYDGVASPEEIRQIKSYFVETVEIPSDLEADSRIFAALTAIDDIEVPERLERDIRSAIAAEGAGNRPRVMPWKAVAGIAAAITLIAVLAARFLIPASDEGPQLLAQAVDTGDTLLTSDVSMTPRPVGQVKSTESVRAKAQKKVSSFRQAEAAAALLEGEASIVLLFDKINEASRQAGQVAVQFEELDKSLNTALK